MNIYVLIITGHGIDLQLVSNNIYNKMIYVIYNILIRYIILSCHIKGPVLLNKVIFSGFPYIQLIG